jgi:hypothetical protein
MVSRRLPRVAAPRESDCFELGAHADEMIDDENSTEEVDIVVMQIKRLARNASLEFALRVGAVIIHHFYAGDTEAWRSKGPKTASFRALARHPELPLSAGSLCRCVALFELCERLNAPARWEHLGASHLRLVLGLPPNIQERILAVANAKRWTVRTLQQEVLREKSARITSGGRRAEAPIVKSLKRVKHSLDSHCDLIERAECVSSRDVEESIHLIEETRQSLERLSRSLGVPTGSAS